MKNGILTLVMCGCCLLSGCAVMFTLPDYKLAGNPDAIAQKTDMELAAAFYSLRATMGGEPRIDNLVNALIARGAIRKEYMESIKLFRIEEGMNPIEAASAWGKPNKILPGENGQSEHRYYGKSVYFGPEGATGCKPSMHFVPGAD